MAKKSDGKEYDDFQLWLLDEKERRDWSNNRIANEVGVFRGTVAKWLLPYSNPERFQPSAASFIAIGEVFGADPMHLMRLAGIDAQVATTQVQADIIAVINQLPDELLITLYPQVRALLDFHVNQSRSKESKE